MKLKYMTLSLTVFALTACGGSSSSSESGDGTVDFDTNDTEILVTEDDEPADMADVAEAPSVPSDSYGDDDDSYSDDSFEGDDDDESLKSKAKGAWKAGKSKLKEKKDEWQDEHQDEIDEVKEKYKEGKDKVKDKVKGKVGDALDNLKDRWSR